jgi:hypothetical protein
LLQDAFDMKIIECINLGLKEIHLHHDLIDLIFVIDLDYDTGTLLKVNNQLIKYKEYHNFSSVSELKKLIQQILAEYNII